MKVIIYKIFLDNLENVSQDEKVQYLSTINYLAIFEEKLPSNTKERINEIKNLKNNYKLKATEISQNQFLDFINLSDEIEKIYFAKEIAEEDEDEIENLLAENNHEKLIKKLKEDNYYYLINGIEVYVGKENIKVILKKNLEVQINNCTHNKIPTDREILELFDKSKLLNKVLPKRGD